MFLTIFFFVIALSVLILVHEAGHFFVARRLGMKAEEFGIGFPPRLWGFRRGETLYSINLLPIGGFVRILGEGGEEVDNPRSFSSRPPGQRLLVLSAGVLVNLLVAFLLFSSLFAIGTPQQTIIKEVIEGTPAAESGLRANDIVVALRVGDTRVSAPDMDSVVALLQQRQPDEEVVFEVVRGNGVEEIFVGNHIDASGEAGPVGVALGSLGVERVPWYQVPWYGALATYSVLVGTFAAFGEVIGQGIGSGTVPEGVGGPVGIANVVIELRDFGWLFFAQLMGIISLNLALLNSIPFPALDGGRMLFVLIEKIKGSPVNRRVEGLVHMGGFALLIALIVLVTFNDIKNLVT